MHATHCRTLPVAPPHQALTDQQIFCVLKEHSEARLVTLTATDSSPEFEELIENWICSVKRVGIAPVIWALDQATHTKLRGRGDAGRGDSVGSVLSEDVRLTTEDAPNTYKRPSGRQYTSAVALKPRVVSRVLALGFDTLFLDVDVALNQDPRPWLLRHVTQSASHLQISLNLGNPEGMGKKPIDVNSGVLYVRAEPAALTMVNLWSNRTASRFHCSSWSCGDQEQLTRILKECGWRHIEQHLPQRQPQPQLVLDMTDNVQQELSCLGHRLRVDALPPRYFSCGSSTSIALWKSPKSGSAGDLISFHPTHLGMSSYVKERQLRSLRPLNRPLWCANTTVHM